MIGLKLLHADKKEPSSPLMGGSSPAPRRVQDNALNLTWFRGGSDRNLKISRSKIVTCVTGQALSRRGRGDNLVILRNVKKLAELIILGSGTGIPSLRRGSPGLLVLTDGTKLLIDSGSGTLRRLLEVGITYRDLDILLYTHIHPDHVSDLVPIIFATKYADVPREKDLLCVGGPGFESYFEKLKNLYGRWIEPQSYQLVIKEASKEALLFRDLRIISKPMAHISESIGYRIEFKDGKSMAVSGDTDYCQNIVDLASHADLLILECSFPDDKKVEGHLTPSLAGRIATESRCKRLALTHLYPVCDQFDIVDQCRQAYQGEIILGEDLMSIAI